jgi:CheY-like chemotaxis protein
VAERNVPNIIDLDEVLDRLRTAVQTRPATGLEAEVQRYVEEGIEVAMSAAGRTRDTPFARSAPVQIREAVATARALLEELRTSERESSAIIDRSLELRRQAIRLIALSLPARPARNGGDDPGGHPLESPPLHGVRVLLLSPRPEQEEGITLLLATLGAQVEGGRSVEQAADVARAFHPDVLVCDVPLPAAEALICELRRSGVVAPALAVAPVDDGAVRSAGQGAGFSDVIARPLTLAGLARAIRAALGA